MPCYVLKSECRAFQFERDVLSAAVNSLDSQIIMCLSLHSIFAIIVHVRKSFTLMNCSSDNALESGWLYSQRSVPNRLQPKN